MGRVGQPRLEVLRVEDVYALPTTVPGLLPEFDRTAIPARPDRLRPRRTELGDTAASVLNFRQTNGYATVGGAWSAGVSSEAATLEGWIRTSVKDPQTILLGQGGPGAAPRLSVGGDQLSVYWSASGDAESWTSSDTTPVTDGQWHHVAAVFFNGTITFYKDGVSTGETFTIPTGQTAGGQLQLGAGLGSTEGFLGQMWNMRVWSVPRDADQIADSRWTTAPSTTGLTASVSFDAATDATVNDVGGATGALFGDTTIIDIDTPQPTCALSLSGGASDNVEVVTEVAVSSSGLTLECWVQITAGDDNPGPQVLFSISTIATRANLTFTYVGGQQLAFAWAGDSYTSSDTRVIADGRWHHVALVFDSDVATFYKDGVACPGTYTLVTSQATPEAGLTFIGPGRVGQGTGIDGLMYDMRVWNETRSNAEISAFRWVTLTGTEDDLQVLLNFTGAGADPSTPDGLFPRNVTGAGPCFANGNAAVVVTPLPAPPLATGVWVYPVPGSSPIGPSHAPTGIVCTANGSVDAPAAVLQSVDVQTGQVGWTYDARTQSRWADAVVANAVTVTVDRAYVGVTSATVLDDTELELHVVDTSDGTLVGSAPGAFPGPGFLTRPVPYDGGVCVGVAIDATAGQLIWGAVTDATQYATALFANPNDPNAALVRMSTPALADLIAHTAAGWSGLTVVAAVDLTGTGQDTTPSWTATLPAALTGDLAVDVSGVYVPTGNTVVALNPADGSQLWSHPLGGPGDAQRPVTVGDTVCVADTAGILYALDTATGDERWRVDTGSPITTDLLNEDGVLYFANQGDGNDIVPTFLAVDTASSGNDVLTYEVPSADTILFVQAGVHNGVVYFYSLSEVYAVNMATVIREFEVSSKLIVEDFTYPGNGVAQGDNTSYRVTLKVRDELGIARVGEALKIWADEALTLVNQGAPVAIGPDTPAWLVSDQDGELTIAVDAWDTTSPDGHQDLSCPALRVWANFMAPDETIVIYPDHEQLTTLATLGGTTPTDDTGLRAPVPGVIYLDTATSYDGTPLIAAGYTADPAALDDIAQSIRNTMGTVSPAVTAPGLTGSRTNRYVRPGAVIANTLYSAALDEPTLRPYQAAGGANAMFTIDLSVPGVVTFSDAYDPSAPASAGDVSAIELGSIGSFFDKVLRGTERVVKHAWSAVDDAAQFTIHTIDTAADDAAHIYADVVTSLEDAVSVVGCFFKSVLADAEADLRRVVQFLSALFSWENMLANHAVIRKAITDPDGGTGTVQQLQTRFTLASVTGTFAQLTGQGQTQLNGVGSTLAGQTAGQTTAGNGDPNAAYNYGGNNNATQCTYMHQKLKENAAGAQTGALTGTGGSTALGATWNADVIVGAWKQFLTAGSDAVSTTFDTLPGRLRTQVGATAGRFTNPKSIAGTAFTDVLTTFELVADDLIAFGADIAEAILDLIVGVLDQILAWLDTPIEIPFLSELWKAITRGDDLTVLDLVCMLVAVPSTILLDVVTGNPTVPATDNGEARAILLGIAGFLSGTLAMAVDEASLYYSVSQAGSAIPGLPQFWSVTDIGVDTANWALGAAVGQAGGPFGDKDWTFWALQALPIIGNITALSYVPPFMPADGAKWQLTRDVTWGVCFLVLSAVYAGIWNKGYRDLSDGKADGLVISANTLAALSDLVEAGLFAFDPNEPQGQIIMIGKGVFAETSNLLNWIGTIVDGAQP